MLLPHAISHPPDLALRLGSRAQRFDLFVSSANHPFAVAMLQDQRLPGGGSLTGMREWDVLTERGLASTPGLDRIWKSSFKGVLRELVLLPTSQPGRHDVAWADSVINDSDWPLLPNLVPLMPVDERSFACVVLSDLG